MSNRNLCGARYRYRYLSANGSVVVVVVVAVVVAAVVALVVAVAIAVVFDVVVIKIASCQ